MRLSSNLKKEKGNEYWPFLNQLLSNFGEDVNNSPSSCVQLLDWNKADIFISWCDNFFGPKIQNNTKYFEKNSQAIQPIKTSTCLCFSRLSSRTYHWAKTNSNVHWIQTRNKFFFKGMNLKIFKCSSIENIFLGFVMNKKWHWFDLL